MIVHAVPNSGAMDGGLTRQLVKKFPQVIEPCVLFCNAIDTSPLDRLGSVVAVPVSEGLAVANVFCIHDHRGKKTFENMAFKTCLDKIQKHTEKSGETVYFPYKMGAGSLGGDWKTVEKLIGQTLGKRAVICLLDSKRKENVS